MAVESKSIRVLCVDDHRLVREGIAWLIGLQKDIDVVGHAATGEEAIALFRQHRPDITLMDLKLPGMSGLEAIRAIRQHAPDARIIVLTMYQGEEDVYRAIQAGAATYLLKDMLYDDLVRIIRDVHSGGRPLSRDIERRLEERTKHGVLTPREIDVVRLIGQGMRNKQIAASLSITEDTVQSHLKNIFVKLEVTDRTAMLSVALRRGLIHLD